MPSSLTEAVDTLTRGPLPVLAATTAATTTFSGPEVLSLSAFLNVVAQPIKAQKWFKQNVWLVPLLLVLGVGLAFLVAWLVTDDIRQSVSQAILKGPSATWQSLISYSALSKQPGGLGVLGPGTD